MDRQTRLRIDALYRDTRRWFARRGFCEVRTNILGETSGFDGYVKPFSSVYERPLGSTKRTFLLRSSPELEMKKLVFRGSGPVYQICRCFRNSEYDATHRPEFDLLEWYAPGVSLPGAMSQVEGLVRGCCGARGTVNGKKINLSRPFERISMKELFRDCTGIDLASVQDRQAFVEAARAAGSGPVRSSASWDTVFFVLFLEKVEPALTAMDRPVLLHGHPVQVASLAAPLSAAVAFVDRFELVLGGLEICNGYRELTTREGHISRLESVNTQRRQEGFPDLTLPPDFLDALPSTDSLVSGVALGMERLAMVATGCSDIAGVTAFDPLRSSIIAGSGK